MAEPVMAAPVMAFVVPVAMMPVVMAPVVMAPVSWLAGQQARSRRRQTGLRRGLAAGP